MNFKTISQIEPGNPASWHDSVFITLDIDWCHDDVLVYAIDLLEQADVAATWFVTHETPLLERLRDHPKFELGIHPNFNRLLAGLAQPQENSASVMDNILKIVPDAKAVRSHSMTQNSQLLQLFQQRGLIFDCNHFIPHHAGYQLTPFSLWNGLIKIPYFWEDDLHCIEQIDFTPQQWLRSDSLNVFDFHPIHLFLNTHDLALYEETRDLHYQPDILASRANRQQKGARDWLLQLINQPIPSQ